MKFSRILIATAALAAFGTAVVASDAAKKEACKEKCCAEGCKDKKEMKEMKADGKKVEDKKSL